MNPSGGDTTKLETTSQQVSELAAIRRMLEISEGTFSFSVAVCNNPSLRNYLIKKLREEYSSIKVVEIKRNVTDIFDFVSKNITSKKSDGVFVIGIEAIVSSDEKEQNALQSLNATREAWKSRFSCPVVFWVAEYAAKLLSIHARDLWSWLSHSFEFVSEQATASAGMTDTFSGDILSAGRLDADEKRFRIAELEQRITDAGDPPKARFIQHILNWLNELSYIYFAIGDLDKAEQILKKSLEMVKKLNWPEGMITDYGNLGIIYRTRGELDKAEQIYKKLLEIEEKLDRPEGMAGDYDSLGMIYKIRGELNKAEQMHKKSLKIYEKLGRLEGMANQYGNLGVVYLNKGELDKAELMNKKSLGINEKLGRPEGMAGNYGNLGLVYLNRGELDKAEQMFKKSLEIDKKLGQLIGIAGDYGNLGLIYQIRGEFDKAEQIIKKSLELCEKLGLPDVMAKQYGNLGMVYEQRGDLKRAMEFWGNARDLFKKVGMENETKKMERFIDGIKEK